MERTIPRKNLSTQFQNFIETKEWFLVGNNKLKKYTGYKLNKLYLQQLQWYIVVTQVCVCVCIVSSRAIKNIFTEFIVCTNGKTNLYLKN